MELYHVGKKEEKKLSREYCKIVIAVRYYDMNKNNVRILFPEGSSTVTRTNGPPTEVLKRH